MRQYRETTLEDLQDENAQLSDTISVQSQTIIDANSQISQLEVSLREANQMMENLMKEATEAANEASIYKSKLEQAVKN